MLCFQHSLVRDENYSSNTFLTFSTEFSFLFCPQGGTSFPIQSVPGFEMSSSLPYNRALNILITKMVIYLVAPTYATQAARSKSLLLLGLNLKDDTPLPRNR